MIKLTYYEKKTIRLTGDQLLALDEKIRKELGVDDDEHMLVHDILIHGRKHGLVVRIPSFENIEPDDECGPPTKSHLGYTREELVTWVAQQEADQTEGIPDIFEDLDK